MVAITDERAPRGNMTTQDGELKLHNSLANSTSPYVCFDSEEIL